MSGVIGFLFGKDTNHLTTAEKEQLKLNKSIV